MTIDTIGSEMKVRVFTDHHHHTFIQCTHNGSQWQSINLTDIKDIRLLWQEIGRYLGEQEYNSLKEMSDERFHKLLKAVQEETNERGAG